MQIRPTAFTIGLIIPPSIALFCVCTEFGIDSLKKVKDNITMLDSSPLAFPIYPHISRNEYRFIPVGNYLFFYHVDESKAIVYIDRFLYSARNIEAVL